MADNTDPAHMTDEELDKAINPAAETPEEPEKPEEPKPTEEPEEPETPEPKEEEQEEEEEKPPSRREQLRVQQLLARLKEDKVEPAPKPVADQLDYERDLDTDPETAKRLVEDRDRSNREFYNQGLEQANSLQFKMRLEIDAPKVATKYPFLDQDSQDFNARAAAAVNTRYLQFVGYDANTQKVIHPDIRYSDFIEAEMEFASEIAKHKVADATLNVKKQAARTGLRPDGSGTKKLNLSKPPEQMTDEELDAVIAQAIPTR